MLASLQNGRR